MITAEDRRALRTLLDSFDMAEANRHAARADALKLAKACEDANELVAESEDAVLRAAQAIDDYHLSIVSRREDWKVPEVPTPPPAATDAPPELAPSPEAKAKRQRKPRAKAEPPAVDPTGPAEVTPSLVPHDMVPLIMKAREQHPGAILVFQRGETCLIATSEDQAKVSIAGVPLEFLAADLQRHVKTLLKAGEQVVLCDQKLDRAEPPVAPAPESTSAIICWFPDSIDGQPVKPDHVSPESWAECLASAVTLPAWWGRADDRTATWERMIVGSLLRGSTWTESDRTKVAAITDWRSRLATGMLDEREPLWDRWAEFDVLLEDGVPVSVLYFGDASVSSPHQMRYFAPAAGVIGDDHQWQTWAVRDEGSHESLTDCAARLARAEAAKYAKERAKKARRA